MLEQHPSKIFKVDFRRKIESKNYICFEVLDKNNALGSLNSVKEESFGPLIEQLYDADEDQTIILLPIIGGIDFNATNSARFIHIHQIFFQTVKKGKSFSITNPYEQETISFLHLRVASKISSFLTKDFNFDQRNNLTTVIQTQKLIVTLGIFDARNETEYQLKNSTKGVFAYIIKGAFEFQNRLLEDRDALSIWDIQTIEMESLAENSLILIVELLD